MNAVSKYFNGERIQCTVGVVISLIAIGIALYFYFKTEKTYYIGMAYPFIIIGILFFIICISVVIRSPKDIVRVDKIIQSNPSAIKSEELPRMESVLRNFKIIIWVEVGFIIAGAILLFVMSTDSRWQGVGTGLFIMAAALLLFDIIAASRGKEYYAFLQTFN